MWQKEIIECIVLPCCFFVSLCLREEMLRARIDRRTNIFSPTVFLCLKHNLFLTRHKWLKLFCNSNIRTFFWWIQKRAICIYCGISNLICSCISFFSFQFASAYSIYQNSQSIKVNLKHIEKNADEISQDLHFNKKDSLGIKVYFCLVP